jgi:glycosyltransferase involved in cell wall biosynthesis
MSPLVTVVIPCFRQGHLLATAVRTALSQTYSNTEVVVVNDGSDDDTETVAKGFGDRIRYVRKPNGGLSSARNAGVRAASGELLHFLDADDAIHPEAISRLVGSCRDVRDPLAMMGWRPFETEPGIPSGEPRMPPDDNEAIKSILTANYGPPHNFLSTRVMFDKVGGFDERMSGCADWDFWLRQLFAGATPVSVPFIGAFYRQSENQMSRRQLHMDEELAAAIGNVVARITPESERVREWGLDPDKLRRAFSIRAAREYANVGYLRREQGDYLKSAAHYWRCLRFGGWSAGICGLAKLPVVAAGHLAGWRSKTAPAL